MKKVLLIATMLLSSAAQAETIVATCYEPSGYRVEVFQGELDKGEDGYSNSSPTFFYSSHDPEVLIESWQAALPSPELISRAEADAILPPSAIKSEIIIKTDELIHASSADTNNMYTTTLYLNQESAVFTRVRVREDWVTGTVDPMGAVYFAKCNIQIIE